MRNNRMNIQRTTYTSKDLENAKLQGNLELDAEVEYQDSDGGGTYGDYLVDPRPNPEEELLAEERKQIILKAIAKELRKLSDRDRDIVMRYFGIEPYHQPQSQVVIAEAVGLTQQAISQIITAARKNIQKNLKF